MKSTERGRFVVALGGPEDRKKPWFIEEYMDNRQTREPRRK